MNEFTARKVQVKVSVIMPVYNVERYLPEALDAVLGQTLSDIEVICVDDCSTDGSLAILKRYAQADPRLTVICGEHAGAYKARERAFAVASGRYVYFMDADDGIEANAFEECYELCEREHLDHLVFTTVNFTSDGEVGELNRLKCGFDRYYALDSSICDRVMSGRDLMAAMMDTGRYFVGPPLRFIRTAPLKENDYLIPDAPYHGDNYFTTVSLFLSERAMAVNRAYYRRRVHGASITTSKGKERVHFSSILNVIVALCRFPPFRDRACSPETAECRYLQELVGSLMRRSRGIDAQFECDVVSRLAPPLSPEMRVFVQACFLPLLDACRERERTARGTGRLTHVPSCRGNVFSRAVQCLRENGLPYTVRRILFGRQY